MLSATPPNETLLHTDASILPSAEAGDGLVELPHVAPAVTTREKRDGQLRHDPAAAAADRRPATSSRSDRADRVDPRTVIAEMVYEHPIYNPESLAAQRRLPELTTPSFALAGAWHGWGFHEDGARSGLEPPSARRSW